MKNILRDFYSEEDRHYKFRIGSLKASSLSGFIAGVLFTSIILGSTYLIYYLIK
jgi:predicted PurR-regulated permease PerM